MNKTHKMTKIGAFKRKIIVFKKLCRENSFYSKTLLCWVKLYAKVNLYFDNFFSKCKFVNFFHSWKWKRGTFLQMNWKKYVFFFAEYWTLYLDIVMIILKALLIKKPNIISHLQFSYLFLRFSKVSSPSSQSL